MVRWGVGQKPGTVALAPHCSHDSIPQRQGPPKSTLSHPQSHRQVRGSLRVCSAAALKDLVCSSSVALTRPHFPSKGILRADQTLRLNVFFPKQLPGGRDYCWLWRQCSQCNPVRIHTILQAVYPTCCKNLQLFRPLSQKKC